MAVDVEKLCWKQEAETLPEKYVLGIYDLRVSTKISNIINNIH